MTHGRNRNRVLLGCHPSNVANPPGPSRAARRGTGPFRLVLLARPVHYMARAGTMKDLLAGRIKKQRKKRAEKSSVPPQRKGRQWTKREFDPVIILAGPEPRKTKR